MAVIAGPYIIEIGGLRGVSGFSAAQVLFNADLIEAPTAEAMTEYLTEEASAAAVGASETIRGETQAFATAAATSATEADTIRATTQGIADTVATDAETVAADKAAVANDLTATTGQKAIAVQAAADAENAAAAAQAILLTYPDTTTGLAATAEGSYFYVAGSGLVYATRYRKVGGAATSPVEYSSKAALDATIEAAAENSTVLQVAAVRSARDLSYIGSADIIPDVTAIDPDGVERLITGYRQSDGAKMFYGPVAGPGVEDAIDVRVGGYITDYSFTGTGDYVPLWMLGNQAVAYYDKALGRVVLSDVLVTGDSGLTETLGAPAIVTYATGYNGAISYGQSLSYGYEGDPAVTLAQPFYNVTFAGGVKSSGGSDILTFAPLIEDNKGEDAGVSSIVGETVCSSLANHAVRLAAIENGRLPTDFRIFASAPGKTGQPIDNLIQGTATYNRLLTQVTAANAIAVAAGKTLTIQAIHWKQGEYENQNGGTTRAAYLATLLQLQADLQVDILAITGQAQEVHFLIYQTIGYARSTGTGAAPGLTTLAQFDAVRQSPYFHFVGALYNLPVAADNLHLTNVGYARFGHMDGRAYKHLVVDGRKPDCVWPISAILIGTTLTIRFTSPTPLTLDTVGLAATTDHGFKVSDESGAITLSNIAVTGDDTVTMTLSRVTGTAIVARYGLDYIGTGLTYRSGGTGNLRDTTADTCTVSGTSYPLCHLCPHFELTVVKLEA